MNTRKVLAGVAGLAATASLLFNAAPAKAADTGVTFTLQQGTLSIAVASPGTIDLGTKTPSGVLSQFSGNLLATTVTDSRNSTVGWTAYASSTDFTKSGGTAGDTIDNANVNISVSAASALTVGGVDKLATSGLFVPTPNGANGDATHGSGVAGGSIAQLVGNVLATDVLTSSLVTANNATTYTPLLTVTVPANTNSGTFSGTVSQTVA